MHAARRTRAGELAPQHGRERETDEIVERAAREIGVHQRVVDRARMPHGFLHGILGDRVENDAVDLLVFERALLFQDFQHVPGNRFAFAVGVGREDQAVRAFHGGGDLGEALLRLAVDLPDHREVVVGQNRAVFRGQVAHMAIGGEYLEIGPEIFVDRLRLGRRLDNDDVHSASEGYREQSDGSAAPRGGGNMVR